MSRTSLFRRLQELARIAQWCEATGTPTREALEFVHEETTRRQFLGQAARGALALGAVPLLGRQALAAPKPAPGFEVAIVGAGMAGLACAYALQQKGIGATLYEAADYAGGRVRSMGGAFPGPVEFPGQVIERGGELIDTLHTTMRGYATEFGLQLERMDDAPGEIFYHVGGQLYREDTVVDEYRALVPALQSDLRTLGAPTADFYTEADRALDLTDMASYLRTRGAGDVIRGVIDSAYVGEYGLELAQQSSLALLLFIHADRRSRFLPFGVFSNERYHVIGGNQQIPQGIRDRLVRPVEHGHLLESARRDTAGRVELTFAVGRSSVTRTCDAVVFATPFSTLRQVDLRGLSLPDWKRYAIDNLAYGTNAKMMIGFEGRPWIEAGCTGTVYASGLSNVQVTWESNPSRATPFRGVLTDYSGGVRGASLDPKRVQRHAADFLADLERVLPGVSTRVSRDGADVRAHLEHWPSNPLQRGSYTANQPGYFTTICDNEAKPVGNVFFAGEHASSFYEWQGFMEGAALSGLTAASGVTTLAKR